MNHFTKILLVLTSFFFTTGAFATYGIYYGTSAKYAKQTYNRTPMIIQDYNFALYSGYAGPKICYLSVGESDDTYATLTTLGLTGAVLGFNAAWNSYYMNMSDSSWQAYLIKREGELHDMGCNGLFLDTIWQDGQEAGAIDIVGKLRANWASAFIIVNNAHYIKESINPYVDGYMFEDFWTYGTKMGTSDGDWYVQLFGEYLNLATTTGKKLYALNYTNPNKLTSVAQKAWYNNIVAIASTYHFELVFANGSLTQIHQ